MLYKQILTAMCNLFNVHFPRSKIKNKVRITLHKQMQDQECLMVLIILQKYLRNKIRNVTNSSFYFWKNKTYSIRPSHSPKLYNFFCYYFTSLNWILLSV